LWRSNFTFGKISFTEIIELERGHFRGNTIGSDYFIDIRITFELPLFGMRVCEREYDCFDNTIFKLPRKVSNIHDFLTLMDWKAYNVFEKEF